MAAQTLEAEGESGGALAFPGGHLSSAGGQPSKHGSRGRCIGGTAQHPGNAATSNASNDMRDQCNLGWPTMGHGGVSGIGGAGGDAGRSTPVTG